MSGLLNRVIAGSKAAWQGFPFDRIGKLREQTEQRLKKLAAAGSDWQRRAIEAGYTVETTMPEEIDAAAAEANNRCTAELRAIGREVSPAMGAEHRRLIEDAAATLSPAADAMDRLRDFEKRQASFLAQCGLPQVARVADSEITGFKAMQWALNARAATAPPQPRAARPAPTRIDLSSIN